MLRPIRRALLSVSDKTGLVEFARELVAKYGVELIATGGTRKLLADHGLPVKDVAEITKFPEMLDGRVKSLHPAIFAGLLAKRDKPDHMATLAEHGLPEIDLVVCNLYPFEQTVAKPGVTEAEAIENIDIGGPCMVRAAAKNFESVAVVISNYQFHHVRLELSRNNGQIGLELRRKLARFAFAHVADYDRAIETYFFRNQRRLDQNEPLDLSFDRVMTLRYGENPHQQATFYRDMGLIPECNEANNFQPPEPPRACIASARKLHGKELSYNNILDLDSALNLAREFAGPACVVVKHNNPCGAAIANTLTEAFNLAWDGDPQSAFGGILAFNRPVDADTASAIMDPKAKRFIECVIAPDYEPHALDALKAWKENVRLLKTGPLAGFPQGLDYRRVDGGLLVQTRDYGADKPDEWKVVTKRKPTEAEFAALHFAWFVCKHVKSNAIVLASGRGNPAVPGQHVVGVGAGQMSRVDSVQIAVKKAGDCVKGSVLASDAFFPFPDNVHAAAAAGVTAIIQPGGSVKDKDSIDACDEHGITMLFTGVRHFRH
jgi:phosphoribosylaminoimidazolecarboxamide formyltransferase / IMP cyclohydrolase